MSIRPEFKETSMSQRRRRGFSLLELLVALMIIGVIATLGFNQVRRNTAKARHAAAADKVKIMADGLDMYYIQNGKYPELGSWDALIAADSPLVKSNMIPPNMPSKDPWDNPYEATVSKVTYTVRCGGDPGNQEELGEIVRQPGKLANPSGQPAAAPATPEGAPK